MVLIVEDDVLSRKALTRLLRANGHDVEAVGSAEEALDALRQGLAARVVLIDVDLPGMNGLQLITALSREFPGISAILTTAVDRERLVSGGRFATSYYLRKPLQVGQLLSMVASADSQAFTSAAPALRAQ
jgi:two-component system, response regulator FlrC